MSYDLVKIVSLRKHEKVFENFFYCLILRFLLILQSTDIESTKWQQVNQTVSRAGADMCFCSPMNNGVLALKRSYVVSILTCFRDFILSHIIFDLGKIISCRTNTI